MTILRVGDLLFGYCGGAFGRDSYEDKRVETMGTDWVVCRDGAGRTHFADSCPEDLTRYLIPDTTWE